MSAMFRSLAVANYRLWFAGALVSNIGVWLQRTAQDWLVLTELTDQDAAAVGVTMALQFGPLLVLAPVSGLIADRLDRRRLLIATQSTMAGFAVLLGVLTVLGYMTLPLMWAFALALGIVAAIDAPARQTFVGELVDDRQLSNAVALNSASFNVARLIGPAVAGVLIVLVGTGWVFLANAASFGAVILVLLLMRRDRMRPARRAAAARGQIRDGIRYVRRRPDLAVIFAMIFVVGTFGFNFPIFTATMARVEFGSGAEGFGLLSSILAIGSVTGALLAARRERPRLRYAVLAAAGFGLAAGAAALMPDYWSFAAALVLVGVSSLTLMTSANAYVQTTTSPIMRGRVMALYMAIFAGGTPIGAPLIGVVVNAAGPRWALAVAGLSGLVAAGIALGWLIRARDLRIRYDPDVRFRLSLRYRGRPEDRELATTEIAVVEAETQRS